MKQTILDKNELEYFFVEESYGGNQDQFPDVTMRDGGCGAIAACESCIYFARTNGIKNLYPHQSQEISWKEYHDFAYVMKHYLCPRPNGIDTLELFMEGFGEYLADAHDDRFIPTSEVSGGSPQPDADDKGEHQRHQGNEQGHPCAIDDAAEQIPAIVVCPHQVLQAG